MKTSLARASTLFVAIAALGCQSANSDGTVESPARPPVSQGTRVEVASLNLTDAAVQLQLTGEIEGSRDANLASALGGYVERVHVRSGETVGKGQLLVSIDRALHGAGHAQAKAQRDLAATEFERIQKLGDGASKSQLSQAETQLRIAEAGLQQAAVRLARASVVAPFEGVISAVNVEEGEVTGPGTPVVRIVQLDPVHVITQVADRDVVALKEGLKAKVTAAAVGDQFDGHIHQISRVGDGKTRSFQVDVQVDNPDQRLLPGMVSRVTVGQSLGQAMVIPQDWVISKLDGHGVFVEREGKANWQAIKLGDVIQNQVVVEEGLAIDDRIITVGHRELLDGDPVLVAREGRCCTSGRVTYGGEGS